MQVRAETAPYLKITAIDYGGSSKVYGEATLLESGGEYLLIDTGYKDSNKTVIRYLKQRGARNLSLYISHFHEDHCYYARSILKDSWFHIKKVYLANPDPLTRYVTSYRRSHNRKLYNSCKEGAERHSEILSTAKKKGIAVKHLKKGDTFTLGSAKARVLWDHNPRPFTSFDPYDKEGTGYANNSSLVTKFTLGERSFLAGGDIEASTERDLMANGTNLKADILKLNHHGIWSSNTAAFIKAVNPCYIYYSYKGKNKDPERHRFGSGADVAVTIRKLKGKYNILGTRYNGTITYLIRNNNISVSASRHFKKKTVRVRKKTNGKESTRTLIYNDAQELFLDQRMLPYGTELVSGKAADPSGQYVGWVKESGGWRYKTKNGKWLSGGWKTINTNVYYFDSRGFRREGWMKKNGKLYFMSRIGIRQTGWQMIDGAVYYFYKDGSMASGTIRVEGVRWPLRPNGTLDLTKKNAPDIDVLTVERRHTTKQ